ncbi:hypothetical protein TWF696_007902 [Orbilia brochopaga]|uniref:Carboxylic ester hydrolase n=1 Tax=Orbilia brochopaga TaxID=3140254 RepID=A0AAV9UPZ6_9PEZI
MKFLFQIASKSFLFFFITSLLPTVAARILETKIPAGRVQGDLCSDNEDSPSQFLGIPYAVPPVGERRWKAPERYNGTFSSGTLNATKFAPVCYQFSAANGSVMDPPPYSEDCLYLNVWVPSSANSGSTELPVKVWIHGGANTGGSIENPLYNGCDLAGAGAIVVNIAYRLGPLGFLALETAGITGNFGIQDILLGLQWVQDNIAAFGGDRRKVLLFGQSAGAWNSFIVSTLASAQDLMRAVALESGGGIDLQGNSSAQQAGAQFAARANCGVTDADCLRDLDPETLRDILWEPDQASLRTLSITRPALQPFVDGTIIPQQPSQVGVQVPAVFSTMSQEGTSFVLDAVHDPNTTDPSRYEDMLSTELGPLVDDVYARYPLSSFSSQPYPEFSRAAQIVTDWQWRCPAYRGLVRAGGKGIPVWTYFFDLLPSCPYTRMSADEAALLGPTHAFDIPFVFAHTSRLPRPNGTCDFDATEVRISQTLVDTWTELALTGNASTASFPWPEFSNDTWMGVYIGDEGAVVRSLQANFSICDFWDQIEVVLLEAANKNATNTTSEIPANPTITGTAAGTAGSTETTKPNGGGKARGTAFGVVCTIAYIAVSVLLEVML